MQQKYTTPTEVPSPAHPAVQIRRILRKAERAGGCNVTAILKHPRLSDLAAEVAALELLAAPVREAA